MKTCKNARKCCYGYIYNPDKCAYKDDMEENDPCPKMIEECENIIDKLENLKNE